MPFFEQFWPMEHKSPLPSMKQGIILLALIVGKYSKHTLSPVVWMLILPLMIANSLKHFLQHLLKFKIKHSFQHLEENLKAKLCWNSLRTSVWRNHRLPSVCTRFLTCCIWPKFPNDNSLGKSQAMLIVLFMLWESFNWVASAVVVYLHFLFLLVYLSLKVIHSNVYYPLLDLVQRKSYI